jgi:O-antigen/teichoic acid export membrane protein
LTLWLLSYQWIAIIIQAIISFGLSIIVARFLGIDQFGVYAIATTAGNFLRILIDGGFTTLLQRESAKNSSSLFADNDKLPRYALGYAFLVMLTFSVIALINPFNQHQNTLFAIIFAFSPIVLIELSMSVLRGQGRLARDAILQVISRLFTAFFIVLVPYIHSILCIS